MLSLLYGPTLISVQLILFHLAVLNFTDTPFLPQIEGLWEPYIRQGYWLSFFKQHLLTLCLCYISVILTMF